MALWLALNIKSIDMLWSTGKDFIGCLLDGNMGWNTCVKTVGNGLWGAFEMFVAGNIAGFLSTFDSIKNVLLNCITGKLLVK